MSQSTRTGYTSSILVTRSPLTCNDATSRKANAHRFHIAGQILLGLPLLALVFLALNVGTIDGETAFAGTCSAAWCANDRDNDAAHTDAKAMLMAQVDALGCDQTKRLSPKVAVVNAAATEAQKGRGEWVFDTGVVRSVTFDEAWAGAKAGEVYVLGWCG